MTNQHTHPNTSHTYPDAIIYGIKCGETGEIYIGSTVKTLEHRMNRHRARATQYNNWVVSGCIGKCPYRCCSIQILNRGNYTVFEIEPYPCNTLSELFLREGNIQIQYKSSMGALCINMYIAGAHARAGGKVKYKKQYSKQYYIDNADTILEQSKQYYKANTTKVSARIGVKHDCGVCGGRYTHGNRLQHIRTQKHQRADQASAHHDS
jgi:hypothetical protein